MCILFQARKKQLELAASQQSIWCSTPAAAATAATTATTCSLISAAKPLSEPARFASQNTGSSESCSVSSFSSSGTSTASCTGWPGGGGGSWTGSRATGCPDTTGSYTSAATQFLRNLPKLQLKPGLTNNAPSNSHWSLFFRMYHQKASLVTWKKKGWRKICSEWKGYMRVQRKQVCMRRGLFTSLGGSPRPAPPSNKQNWIFSVIGSFVPCVWWTALKEADTYAILPSQPLTKRQAGVYLL